MGHAGLQSYESFCVVRRGGSWYALAALSIREIVPSPALTPLPGSPPVVAGLCHLRNEFVTVLRLDVLAGEQEPPNLEGQQLVVLTGSSGAWGILVDEVAALEVLEVSIDPESKRADNWAAAIVGSAAYQERVVRVLDVNWIYRLAEQLLEDHASAGTPASRDEEVPLAQGSTT